MYRPIIAALLTITCLTVSAGAENIPKKSCDETALLTLADYVTENRLEHMHFLTARDYGSTAAYLKIRYGELTEQEASQLVHDLVESKTRFADHLSDTYLFLSADEGKASRIIKKQYYYSKSPWSTNISLARAAMLSDKMDSYLDIVASQGFKGKNDGSYNAVVALLDQSDSVKKEFADAAIQRNLEFMAAGFLLARSDLSDFKNFAATVNDPDNLKRYISEWYLLPSLHGGSSELAAQQIMHLDALRLSNIFRAEQILGGPHYLTNMTNYSQSAPISAVALELIERAKDETIDLESRSDEKYTEPYRMLLKYLGSMQHVNQMVRPASLISERHYTPKSRIGPPNLRTSLDWMFAVEAMTPYVAGNQERKPKLPATISKEFSKTWPQWFKVADAIRTGTLNGLALKDPVDQAMAAELLFAAKQDHALASLILGLPKSEELVILANDFAIRMDRTCANYLQRPGESHFLASVPLFKFDNLLK